MSDPNAPNLNPVFQGHQQASPVDLDAQRRDLEAQIAAIDAQKSAATAQARQQAAIPKDAPMGDGEWQYTVKVGDVLRFPASVHKVEGM